MFKVKVKRTKDFLPNLKRRLKELEGSVKVGYFQEQGKHQGDNYGYEQTQKLYYTQLMAVLSGGSRKNNIPPRPVFMIGMNLDPLEDNKVVKNLLRTYLSRIHKKSPPIKAQEVLEQTGGHYVETFRSIFGDKGLLAKNAPTTVSWKQRIGSPTADSPLMAYGELRAAMSYKINGVLVTPKDM